jgi:hypothetical protein
VIEQLHADRIDNDPPHEFTKDITPTKNSNLRILWIFPTTTLAKPAGLPVF